MLHIVQSIYAVEQILDDANLWFSSFTSATRYEKLTYQLLKFSKIQKERIIRYRIQRSKRANIL